MVHGSALAAGLVRQVISLNKGSDKAESLLNAKWIAPAGSSSTAYFRYECELKQKPSNLLVMFVGSGPTTVTVNGKKQNAQPNAGEKVISGDMTGYFQAGKNLVEVEVSDPGSRASLIGSLDVLDIDGAAKILVTDQSWTASAAKSDTPPAVQVIGPYGMAPYGYVGYNERNTLPARMLRKEFKAARTVKQATAYVTGLGWFELYLNGSKIGNDVLVPALSDYSKRVYYLTYDVTSQLHQGANAIGVILGNGRFFAPRGSFNSFWAVSYAYPQPARPDRNRILRRHA